MNLRDIKARARRDLHQAMRVLAYYYDPETLMPVVGSVRVHTKFDALGDVQGTSFGYAERRDIKPKLIFWRSEIDPVNNAVVMISSEEGYRVNTIDPPDLQTVTAFVTRLSAFERSKYLAPEDGAAAQASIALPGLTSYVPAGGGLPALAFDADLVVYITATGALDLPAFG